MSLFILGIVLFSGVLHVCWNFQVKQTSDKYLSMTAVVLGSVPFTAAAVFFSPVPRPGTLIFIAAGAVLHTGYQLFLLNSYRIGDLSQVYPLSRGVAPLIVAGIMSLTLSKRSDGLRNFKAVILAILTGGFIAAYSLVDGYGARQAGTSLGFYGYVSIANAVLFGAIMGITRPGLIQKTLSLNWKLSIGGGGLSFAAYALIMWAFTQAPIALVSAIRETSMVFTLLTGVVFLKERIDLAKP